MKPPLDEWDLLRAKRGLAHTSVIFRWIDDRMWASEFAAIDELLSTKDLSRFGPSAALGIATISRPVRTSLRERDAYIERLEKYLLSEIGAERTWRLLQFARDEKAR